MLVTVNRRKTKTSKQNTAKTDLEFWTKLTTSFSRRSKNIRSFCVFMASSSFSSGFCPLRLPGVDVLVASWIRASIMCCCSDELLCGVMAPDTTGSCCVCTMTGGGISPIWMRWTRAATSEPRRELISSEPRTEKASSSSAAALTLALSSGRSDSFSSRALNVVPDVMLLPSRLGGFVPSSELESAFCETSSDEVGVRLAVEEESVWVNPSAASNAMSFKTRPGVSGTADVILSSVRFFANASCFSSSDGDTSTFGLFASIDCTVVSGSCSFSILSAEGDVFLGFCRFGWAAPSEGEVLETFIKLSLRGLEPSTMALAPRTAGAGRSFFDAEAATCSEAEAHRVSLGYNAAMEPRDQGKASDEGEGRDIPWRTTSFPSQPPC